MNDKRRFLLLITVIILLIGCLSILTADIMISTSDISIGFSSVKDMDIDNLVEVTLNSELENTFGYSFYSEEIESIKSIGIYAVIGFFLFGLSQLFVSIATLEFWRHDKKKKWFIIAPINLIGFIVCLLIILQMVKFWEIWALLYFVGAIITMIAMVNFVIIINEEEKLKWLPGVSYFLYGLSILYFVISFTNISGTLVDSYLFALLAAIVTIIFIYKKRERLIISSS